MSPSITIVTPTFSPETFGTPLYTTDVACGLRDRGWQVQVVTAQPFYPEFRRRPGYGRATRHDVVEGMKVLRLPTIVPRPGSATRRALTDLNFAFQGAIRGATHQVVRTDAVLSVSPGAPLTTLVGSLCRRRGGVHVAYVHDVLSGLADASGLTNGDSITGDVVRSIERRALRRPDHLATLSPEMRNALVRLGVPPDRVTVSELWATVEAPARPVEQVATLQYSGSMGLKQGLRALVQVFDELAGLAPDVTTLVRGTGPQLSEFRRQVTAVDVAVEFEDPVPEDRLAEALASTPIHLVTQIPGTSESVLPSKVINAMAVGGVVFALAPETSALARLSRECEAVVVADPGDPRGAAKALDELVHDGSLERRRQAALARVAQHHDRSRQITVLESLLRSAATIGGRT